MVPSSGLMVLRVITRGGVETRRRGRGWAQRELPLWAPALLSQLNLLQPTGAASPLPQAEVLSGDPQTIIIIVGLACTVLTKHVFS